MNELGCKVQLDKATGMWVVYNDNGFPILQGFEKEKIIEQAKNWISEQGHAMAEQSQKPIYTSVVVYMETESPEEQDLISLIEL